MKVISEGNEPHVYVALSNSVKRSGGTTKPGDRIGNYMGDKSDPVYSCGPIRTGTSSFILGVRPGVKKWYVLRNGVCFEWEGGKNPRLAPIDPTSLDKGARALWADAAAREFLDRNTSRRIRTATEPMISRYHKLVRAFVKGAIVDCASMNIERETHHFAKACSRDWHERELLQGLPSIRHAVFVSLVCALDDNEGAQLIEYAAWCELRMPIFQREQCLLTLRESRRMLSILLPTWWVQQAATDWASLGTSVNDLFTKQFVRMATDAEQRNLPLDSLIGMRRALTQLGESPIVNRYMDRTQVIGTDAKAMLEKIQDE